MRLIRSKGVGVFFVTQSPTDVPDEVLAQLGSRIQHQLRAHTPNDAKALRATVNTYPTSQYDDLGEVLTSLGIGEAVVTVMNERGAPTPVAWTRLRAPESLMGPADADAMEAAVKASPRYATYSQVVDRESAREMLAARLEEGARKAAEDDPARGAGARGEAREVQGGREGEEGGGRRRHRQGCRAVERVQGLRAHGGPRDRPGDVQVRSSVTLSTPVPSTPPAPPPPRAHG